MDPRALLRKYCAFVSSTPVSSSPIFTPRPVPCSRLASTSSRSMIPLVNVSPPILQNQLGVAAAQALDQIADQLEVPRFERLQRLYDFRFYAAVPGARARSR